MLVSLKQILAIAEREKTAIAQFNAPNMECAAAAVRAAERLKTPVILSHAECHEALIKMEEITSVMLFYAKRAEVPVCVHYDHGEDFGLILKAMKLGFTGVMFDGSKLAYEDNVRQTAEIVRIARALGVDVEAELGRTLRKGAGNLVAEDAESAEARDFYTKPDEARDYTQRTGIDALAIAFGATHGFYTSPPQLDFEVLQKLQKAVPVPLVLHGGSGISDGDFKKCIRYGIRKINYYTYMAKAAGEAVKQMAAEYGKKPLLYHDAVLRAAAAMEMDCEHVLTVFGKN